MKKTLIALAAVAATSAAFAQSSVTIYGRLDVGLNNQKTTTTVGGVETWAKTNALVQEDGLSTGLIGFRGTEDLGGGLKANFVHEMDLDMDVGALGVGLGRNSTVGLEGGFGNVRLGRSYTPMFSTIGISDPFGTTGAGTVNLFPDGVRVSKSIFYTTPNFGGFTVDVAVGRNDDSTSAAVAKTDNTGISAKYAAGPLVVAAAYGKLGAEGAVESETKGQAISATYDFGVAKLFLGHTRSTDTPNTAVSGTNVKLRETNVGVTVPMGAVTLLASLGRNDSEANAGGASVDADGTDLVVGATYSLSKRTTAYIKTGRYNKLEIDDANGTKTTRTSIGLRHTF